MKCDPATPTIRYEHEQTAATASAFYSLRGVAQNTAVGNSMRHICAGLCKHGKSSRLDTYHMNIQRLAVHNYLNRLHAFADGQP